ncbi:MAG: hypothetical protein PHH75_00510 [Candidatus Omnitrophica bacterium]|nr:hypothetical protein [Candidatus Omnitrophota bacterium]MDD5573647.1 hypothetical protein [Candidatus Omnitrophota bacterium]
MIELVMVLCIFLILFSMFALILRNADRGWEIGRGKIVEAQEARRAADKLAGLVREANPDWVINATHYPVTISSNNTRIDFYRPVFNASGIVTSLQKVTFKLDPADETRLLMKEGTAAETVAASSVEDFFIGCGCSGCTAVDQACPRVRMEIETFKEVGFNWETHVTLRNLNMTVSAETAVEEPDEGEF